MFRLTLIIVFAALIAVSAETGKAAPTRSTFVGSWRAEQLAPGGLPRRQGTLVIAQDGDELTGVMRLGRSDVRLDNVRESDAIISFSMPAPDAPNVTLNFSGAIRGNALGVASQDLGRGSYTLIAQRGGAPAQSETAQPSPRGAEVLVPETGKGSAASRTALTAAEKEAVARGLEELEKAGRR